MSPLDRRDPVRAFGPPRASDALRARVLARAAEAVASAARPTRADRIWFSRGYRLAWVGALVAMILFETLSSRATGVSGGSGSPAPAAASEGAAAAEAMGLPVDGWIGERVVTSDQSRGDVVTEAL